MKPKKWTREKILEVLETENITSLKDLRNYNATAAQVATKIGLTKELNLSSRKPNWTKKDALSEVDNNYKTESEIQKNDLSLYRFLKKTGILPHLAIVFDVNRWDEDSILKYISDNNITTIKELIEKNPSVYVVSRRLGMNLNLKRVRNDIIKFEDIQKYVEQNNITDRTELLRLKKDYYHSAYNRGCFDLLGI